MRISEKPIFNDEFYERARGEGRKTLKTERILKRKKLLKFTLIILLGLIFFVFISLLFQKMERSFLMMLFFIAVGVTVDRYQSNKNKEKEIEQLKKDWVFCKSLLDDAREVLTEEQNERLLKIYAERENQKESN